MKRQTVIGIFDYGVDAQMAAQQLMKNGIPDNMIDVAVRGATDRHGNAINRTSTDDIMPRATVGERIDRDAGFFDSLFDNRDESSRYSEVANHGSVVTVHTESEEEARRAAKLLDTYGAIDVNERAEKYKALPREERGNWINSSIPVVQ